MTILVVEDGTGVTNANSYTTLVNARTFADSRGLTFPADDDEACIALINGYDYVEGFRSEYAGQKSVCGQGSQFPRKGLCIDGCPVAENSIPFELIHAQIIAASLHSQGTALVVNTDRREIASQRVEGAVARTFFQTGSTTAQPFFKSIDRLLTPLFKSSQPGQGAPGILIGVRI